MKTWVTAMNYAKNKECTMYLGVHVAEQVLCRVFKDVEVMPIGNRGYDFICNYKLIDVKSATLGKNGSWAFQIRRNTTADFFLCLAFDNRKDLTPLHIWLLPGEKFNHLRGASICPSTIHKWDEYRLDLKKVSDCIQLKDDPTVEVQRTDGDDIGHPSTIDRKQRKTHLVTHIKNHWHEMKESKLIATYCLKEEISLQTARIYLEELIMEDRIGYVGGVLQAVKP